MKKNRMKFLIIEFLLLLLAVFFVWKIFDQNVAEPRIAVILPESGDKRWDALIKGMKQAAAENNVHMIICNTEEIDGPEAEREFIREQKDNDIDGFIIYPAPGHETENMLKKECGKKPYLLIADGLAVKEGETASPTIQPDYREIGRWLGERLRTKAEDRNYRRLENVRGCTGGDLWIERGAGRQRKQDQLVYLPEKRTGHCGADEEGNRGGCSCHPGCRNIGRVWRAGRKWNIRGRGALWSGLQSEDNCTSG